jgi:hypothetical protein
MPIQEQPTAENKIAALGKPRRPVILDRLQSKNDEDLLNIFKNCMRVLAGGPNEEASLVIEGLQREWERRVSRSTYTIVRPNVGMLAELGYRVGNNGERLSVRRQILKHVVERGLPVVGSVAYTAEWGKPKTRERVQKLTNFFVGMIENARGNPDMTTAVAHWEADLEWVQEQYGHLLGF